MHAKPFMIITGIVVALLLLIGAPVAIIQTRDDAGASEEASESSTSTTPPATLPVGVLTGSTDDVPPVSPGGAASWEELFVKEGANPAYWQCFESQTGKTRAQAEDALQAEREGWNVRVTIYANITAASWNQLSDSKGLNLDPDAVEVGSFLNTSAGCNPFTDDRAQVRNALTLRGPDMNTPGEAVVLEHCGNVLPKEHSAPPAQSTPTPETPGRPTTPDTPYVPPTTPPPVAPWKCDGVPSSSPCGTPDSGPEFIPPQEVPPGIDAGPTPGYTPDVPSIGGTPGTGSGGTTPNDGNGNSGTSDPEPTEGSGQDNNGTVSV